MKRRIVLKPPFAWIDADRISPSRRRDLASQLPHHLPPDRVELFLEAVAMRLDEWDKFRETGLTENKQRTELSRVDIAIDRLRHVLVNLDQATLKNASSQFEYLVRGSNATPRLSSELRASRPSLVDWLNDHLERLDELQAVTEYAMGNTRTTNEGRTDREATGLVRSVAIIYRETFGELPSKEWFTDFACELGKKAGTKIGRERVATALANLE